MPHLSWQDQGTIWPEFLKPGDSIGVFAPAGPFKEERFKQGLSILRSMGFELVIPKNIFKKERRYLAGSDSQRLEVMEELMLSSKVKALIAARGGYGCQRLLPFLEERWPRWPRKMIIGFSDITALHLARYKASGVAGFHGPVVTSLTDCDQRSLASFRKSLLGLQKNASWSIPKNNILKNGEANGPILGGNLTLINALLDSPWCPDYQNAILMVEDVGETPYRLDRLLFSLRSSHIWPKLSGLVFGRFVDCGETKTLNRLLKEAAECFHGPVVINAQFGHGSVNRCFPMGAIGKLLV